MPPSCAGPCPAKPDVYDTVVLALTLNTASIPPMRSPRGVSRDLFRHLAPYEPADTLRWAFFLEWPPSIHPKKKPRAA
jgi:hypothetical protein